MQTQQYLSKQNVAPELNKRTMSPEHRRKISEGMKKRWARVAEKRETDRKIDAEIIVELINSGYIEAAKRLLKYR